MAFLVAPREICADCVMSVTNECSWFNLYSAAFSSHFSVAIWEENIADIFCNFDDNDDEEW